MTALRTLFFAFLVLTITACQPEAPATTDAAPAAKSDGPNIVFVRVDSLQTGYTELAGELQRLEENFMKAQENHQSRMASFAKEVQRLQNQAQQGLLTPNKMQSEQQRLARKEQEIAQQRDLALASIQEDQLQLNAQFSERVKAILEDLMAENGYDYILNEGGTGGVLLGADKLDITDQVLAKLNASGTVMEQDSVQ
ncbi:MAG: OmpH family outer membrane protein [Bacteroidota bacterium]